MRKRNLFASLLLVFAIMLTACGEPSPFLGSWKGTCDFTDAIVAESELGTDEKLSKYMDEIHGLEVVFNFEFTEDKIHMSVDEDSVDTFIKNMENSMKTVMEDYMIDELASHGISYEEYLAESGMDSETLLQSMLDEMNMTVQMEAMLDSMVQALDLNGSYMYDEEKLTVVYEDNTYEEIDYTFEGDVLTIIFVDSNGVEYPINCKPVK